MLGYNEKMTKTNQTLFISDLHLDASQPGIAAQFLQLLNNTDSSVDALYVLGDLFEAWIGDDDNNPFHQQIIHALKAATDRGLPIYFLPGNRDFLIGEKFLRETGCQLLADETLIDLYHTPVLLMHGDTLCTRDTAYLRSRKILRHPFTRKLFLLLPLMIRKKIADNMRAASMKHTSSATTDIMDVTKEAVDAVLKKHQAHFLIHGHTHIPGTHHSTIGDQPVVRMVLPAWHTKGSVLSWDAAHHIQMRDILPL
jgi:UDP-2,3-diacylglucosamine hydrolase